MEADLLTLEADEILEKFREDSLPPRWRTVIRDGELRPFHGPGATVVLTRTLRKGALACVAGGARLGWRRILDLGPDGRALLRKDNAPVADGWRGDVIGCVENDRSVRGRLAGLVERAPAGWTAARWQAGYALAVGLGAAARMKARLRGRGLGRASAGADFKVRVMGPADRAAYAELVRRAYRVPVTDPTQRGTGLGLYVGGAMVGAAFLTDVEGGGRMEGELRALVVEPAHRGRGGGRLLARAILDEAARLGLSRVRAYVHAKNLSSLAALQAAGFVPTGGWMEEAGDPLSATRLQHVELAVMVGSF